MVRVKNAHTALVILAAGGVGPVEIKPGGEALVQDKDWDTLMEHPAVRGRVSEGSLVVGEIAKVGDGDPGESFKPKRKFKAKK